MEKSVDAFRTISEVADDLSLPQHVLRFWETRFPQVKPLKRAGGRRYYRPADIVLLKTIRQLLYEEGFTIKGVQKLIKEQGTRAVRAGSVPLPVDLAQVDLAQIGLSEDEVTHVEGAHVEGAHVELEQCGPAGIDPNGTTPAGARRDTPPGTSERHGFGHAPLHTAHQSLIEQAAEPVALPESIRAALAGAIDLTRLSRRDLGALRDALATVEECARILDALRRPRG